MIHINGILVWSPWFDPQGEHRGRVEAQISTFSEYGHVAYQIQGNDVYSNMEANMCCNIQEFHKKSAYPFA